MDFSTKTQWPPEMDEEQISTLHQHVKDWQITHGSLIKLAQTDKGHGVLSHPIGVTLLPTAFPRSCFTRAITLQKIYNELYIKVAEDEEWLADVLKDLLISDPLTQALWSIHKQVKAEGYRQALSCGIFRSDYMLQDESTADVPAARLKQVEFNTYSVAGGSHGNIVADMHRHMARYWSFENDGIHPMSAHLEKLPPNDTIQSLVSAIASAHHAYASSREPATHEMAVLFIVQPNNFNICDERPIEYGLWNHTPPIPAFRLTFGSDVLERAVLDPAGRLLFRPHRASRRTFEISVVYMRAGYDVREYDENGVAARLLLERSIAVKCPSILSHLSTFKKVQQALAVPGVLGRFLTPEKSALLSETFAPLHPLDESPGGEHARLLALDTHTAIDYILKPSLEGGGHNVYGEDIPGYLRGISQSKWADYILMERIRPPQLDNILLSRQGVYRGPIISELGIFGAVIWRKKAGEAQRVEMIENKNAGWSFKTKAEEVDEMSVVKGYGCFDCCYLIDDAPRQQ